MTHSALNTNEQSPVELKDNRRRVLKENFSEAHFWSRVQKPVGCWLYDGAREINGYGYLKNPFREPKYITAHRLAWILKNGPIPEGMSVLHKCDIRGCINPDHLFLGSHEDNMADKVRKGRHHRGELSTKAKLTLEQVREIRRDYKLYSKRRSNAKELAAKYGISGNTITCIIAGRSWAGLD